MHRLGLTLFLPLFLAGCALHPSPQLLPSGSEVVGVLRGDHRWQGEVTLAGDLLIPAGSSLEIAAGTTVFIRPSNSTRIDPEYLSPATEFLVRGRLRVMGEKGEMVRFLPESEIEGEAAWGGILIDGGEATLQHAEIVAAETGLLALESAPQLEAVLIRNHRYGVVSQGGGVPKLNACRIEAGEAGLFCWGGGVNLVDSVVRGNEEEGVTLAADCRAELTGNRIEKNGIGLVTSGGVPQAWQAQLRENGEDLRLLLPGVKE
ncbi:MAG: hypothetical protein C0621_06315 [Desulfuromonas sp.]|nr:MAG: hypothetical protein C0621_06315 [Desulfuromonas sp.]